MSARPDMPLLELPSIRSESICTRITGLHLEERRVGVTTKSRLGNLALLVASLLFCIGLAEAFCRLALPQPNYFPRGSIDLTGLWVDHPTRVVAFAPNFSGTHRTKDFSVPIRIDARGFRENGVEQAQNGGAALRISAGPWLAIRRIARLRHGFGVR